MVLVRPCTQLNRCRNIQAGRRIATAGGARSHISCCRLFPYSGADTLHRNLGTTLSAKLCSHPWLIGRNRWKKEALANVDRFAGRRKPLSKRISARRNQLSCRKLKHPIAAGGKLQVVRDQD